MFFVHFVGKPLEMSRFTSYYMLIINVSVQSAVFALSVLHDADDQLKETMTSIQEMKEKTLKKPDETAMDIGTTGDLRNMTSGGSATVLSLEKHQSLMRIDNLVMTEKELVISRSVLDEANNLDRKATDAALSKNVSLFKIHSIDPLETMSPVNSPGTLQTVHSQEEFEPVYVQ